MNNLDLKVTDIEVEPYFDLEEFMNISKETRIEGATMEKLAQLWLEWLPLLKVRSLEKAGNSWLAVWLPEEIERVVDETWDKSPSQAYLTNALAQYLCMAAVQELLPQVANGGCAPSPKPSQGLHEAVAQGGPGYMDDGLSLARRYAVLTHYPFRGGCEICGLQDSCPKGNGHDEFATVVLPGYERGIND